MQVTVRPSTATARISVKGADWSQATTKVTFLRWDFVDGHFRPLPGASNLQALGGAAVYQDLEMPLLPHTFYAVDNEHGERLSYKTHILDAHDIEWGLWLKSRKAPELTSRIEWEQVGDQTSDTQGAVYEVYGGKGIGQYGGIAPEQFTLYGWVDGRNNYLRLRQLLNTDRQIFIQMGEPKEFEDGWVQVRNVAFPNAENRLIETGSGMRYVRLDVVRIDSPVGAAKGALGSPYRLTYTGNPTYEGLRDSGAIYGDLLGVS